MSVTSSAQQETPTADIAASPEEEKPRRRGRPRKVSAENNQKEVEKKVEKVAKEEVSETPAAASPKGGEQETARRGRWRNKSEKGSKNEKTKGRRREEPEERISDEMAGVTLNLKEVSARTPTELLELADSYGIENAAGMRKQEQVSAILRAHGLRAGTIYSGECWKYCLMALVFCVHPMPIIFQAPMMFMSPAIRFAAFTCARVIR
jgi:transcription termination factor Rho